MEMKNDTKIKEMARTPEIINDRLFMHRKF